MDFSYSTSLINFLGFAVGIALYAMLFVMVARNPARRETGATGEKAGFLLDWRLLATAALGLLWNAGNLVGLIQYDYRTGQRASVFLTAAAFSALGFLPAFIVHSESSADGGKDDFSAQALTIGAYLLSGAAVFLHFRSVFVGGFAPSVFALQILTAGYLTIFGILFWLKRRQRIFGRKGVWMAALAVFSVSAHHLSRPHAEGAPLVIELIAHQASLPLAFAILYQDYRFAFADLFLKRALSFIFLTAFISGVYALMVAPLLASHQHHPQPDTQKIAVLILFALASAYAYPKLNQLSIRLVDRVLLRRVPYERLQTEFMNNISTVEPIESVLDEVKKMLLSALTAKTADLREVFQDSKNLSLVSVKKTEAEIAIPTADEPQYCLTLGDFAGGRRLLSDEIEMLETVALHAARRIDALRVTHERCERELREQEFSKLATEAELRVLRAQINPHFLFNALTTIGYLIQSAPERALQTLLQLTGLLRGSLRSTGEFQTLGDELKLIRSYLEIEQARFEERLQVEINVAEEFLSFRIPSLVLQPLVENAVKHGISPQKKGGEVRIEARRESDCLVLRVSDTGAGIDLQELVLKREARVGLNNVEQRLHLHYGGAADLSFESVPGKGASVSIRFDLEKLRNFEPPSPEEKRRRIEKPEKAFI